MKKPLFSFLLMGMAFPALAQYAGPAVLARGEAPSSLSQPQLSFRPFLELSGMYNTGLANVGVTDTGQLATASSYGVMLAWGISGSHSWKHTQLGLTYRGGFNHYAQKTSYDSIDESLLLGLTHHLSRHIAVDFRETAGIFSQSPTNITLTQTVPFDPTTTYVPTTDYFDNRTMYSESQLNLTIQKSARLSFDLGGNNFLVKRRSAALSGVNSLGAQGDMQYRLTRRTTIGAGYMFEHMAYSHVFGGADAHEVYGSYSVALNATTEFSAAVGVARIELTSLRTVPIDPAISALLGITSGLEVAHGLEYTPTFLGRLTKTFRRGVLYLGGGRSITPGNGLFLTSYASSVMAGYSYTGLRRWSLSMSSSYISASAVSTQNTRYGDVIGSLSLSRQIIRSVHFVTTFSAHRYLSRDFSNYNRLIYVATMGIGFTPGDVPLRLW